MTTLSQTISVALPVSRLETLLSLSRQARTALSAPELGFLLVNGTHALSAFRQSALWLADEGVYALSGVVQIEANAPYVHWLGQVCAHLALLHPADTLTFEAGSLPRFAPLSRFPEVRRDLALVVPDTVTSGSVLSLMREQAGDCLRDLQLFDIYRGAGMPAGHHSQAISLVWQHPDRTLQDAEVQAWVDQVLEALQTRLDVSLRA